MKHKQYVWQVLFNRLFLKQVAEKIEQQLRDRLPEVSGAACLQISALEGHGLGNILPTAIRSYKTWNQRVTTGRLNTWLARVS